MKCLFLFSVAICSFHFAKADMEIDMLIQNYAIISDEFSADVAVGKCLVVGQVTEPDYTGEGRIITLSGGLVSTLDRNKTTTTNTEGKYSLLLNSKDTSLFFYKSGHEEIVVWKYNFRSQHKVTINFYPGKNSSMMIVDKPVIYMYSDEELKAEVVFSCKGSLTFTYPKYDEKWDVTVNQNKITENKTGKTYPYLFWEAQTNGLNFEIDYYHDDKITVNGFIVKTDSIVNFLENSLTALGLNSNEQTDFITFWAPKIIVKPYAFIQFFVDDLYAEKISEMTITPTPDALRRVFLMFTPLETNTIGIPVFPQTLNSFQRKGFTVVEWGGTVAHYFNSIRL